MIFEEEAMRRALEVFPGAEARIDAYGALHLTGSGRDWVIGYAQLSKLSGVLGTNLIDVIYDAGRGPYSDVTPADPSDCQILVRGIALFPAPACWACGQWIGDVFPGPPPKGLTMGWLGGHIDLGRYCSQRCVDRAGALVATPFFADAPGAAAVLNLRRVVDHGQFLTHVIVHPAELVLERLIAAAEMRPLIGGGDASWELPLVALASPCRISAGSTIELKVITKRRGAIRMVAIGTEV